MKFKIEIESGNSESNTREALVDLIRNVSQKVILADNHYLHTIMDTNGNKVGWFMIEMDECEHCDEELNADGECDSCVDED